MGHIDLSRATPGRVAVRMARFIARRLALGLITLLLLSVIVFVGAQVLPGDVGRSILGPFADQEAVDALNEQLGANEPLLTQYLDWIGGVLHGRPRRLARVPAARSATVLGDALVNSAKLAVLAFIIVVPLAIFGGVYRGAARGRRARPGHLARRPVGDRGARSSSGPSLLILVFGLLARRLPAPRATAPPESGFFTQIEYLILPALLPRASCCSATSPGWRARARSRRSTPTTRAPR